MYRDVLYDKWTDESDTDRSKVLLANLGNNFKCEIHYD